MNIVLNRQNDLQNRSDYKFILFLFVCKIPIAAPPKGAIPGLP